jgi:RNA polymerase sigma factor (sigma-70 family)
MERPVDSASHPADPFDTLLPLLARLQVRDPGAPAALGQALVEWLPVLVRPQFHRHFPRLRSAMQTDDVVQEVMLPLITRLLEHPPTSESHYRATVWLIIRRTLLDLIRSHFGPHGWGRNAELGAPELEQAGTTDHRTTREDQMDIFALVAQLPDDEADLIARRFFQGQEMESIAMELGVDRATVRRRIKAILLKLGKYFDL